MFSELWKLTKPCRSPLNIYLKLLNLSNSSKFCNILTCSILTPPSQLHSSLENLQYAITVETSHQEASRGSRMGLELLQTLISRKLLFDLSGSSLQDPICKAVFNWCKSFPSVSSQFNSLGAFVKNNQIRLFNIMTA